jgi:cytochrome b561
MTTNDAVSRYHPLAIGAHWLMLALLIAVYASIELSGIFPKGSASREAMRTWHEMLGITIFGLVFVRLALRLVLRAPVVTPAPPRIGSASSRRRCTLRSMPSWWRCRCWAG